MNGLAFHDVMAMLPLGVLVAGALALLLSEVFLTAGHRGHQAGFAVAISGLAMLAAIAFHPAGRVFGGMAQVDAFSIFVTSLVCGGACLSVLVSAPWLRSRQVERGEYYALVLFAAAGMTLLSSATDLLVAFVGIEVMSLATYALTAWMRRGKRSAEAAFKYFLLGSFSSALFIYGAALIYGATGSLLFSHLGHAPGSLFAVGVGLVGAGLAFKIAAVPFHPWTPDVYEGAPTPVTAFMAVGVKSAAFAVLLRLLMAIFNGPPAIAHAMGSVVALLAILSMVFGNLLALPQRSVKRMLAYSSIAHAGYLLVGVLAAGAVGVRASAVTSVLFYLVAYALAALGAFAVVALTERRSVPGSAEDPEDAWDLTRLAGLAQRRPGLAFVMALFMISLAGVPPSAGFMAKLLIFKAAIGAQAYGLAVIGVLTSALGAFYYLRVVVYLYMRAPEGLEGDAAVPATLSPMSVAALAVCALAVVVVGVGPEPLSLWARAASALVP